MEAQEEALLQRLQTILGQLVCEFRYLLNDLKISSDVEPNDMSSAVSRLELASFCVEMAERSVCEDGVIALLTKHESPD